MTQLGDLLVLAIAPSDPESRPATVADLVSALRAEGVLVVEDVTEFHNVISDTVWLAVYSKWLEAPCEFADLALERFGAERMKDGIGPWPDHHHSLDELIAEAQP